MDLPQPHLVTFHKATSSGAPQGAAQLLPSKNDECPLVCPVLSYNDVYEQGCVLSPRYPQNLVQWSITAHSSQMNQEGVEGVCVPGIQVI